MRKCMYILAVFTLMVGNAMSDEPAVIYEKELGNGNIVIVEKLVRNEHIPIEEVELSKEALEQLGERWGGGRTVRGGDYRIYDVSLKIKDELGKENIVWQKELRALLVPHRDPDAYYMAVYDVEVKDHELAIVYVFNYSIIL